MNTHHDASHKEIIDASFLVGNFNFSPAERENALVESNGIDLWKALRPNDEGFTEDTFKNKMRYLAHGKHKQVRYDRILLVKQQLCHKAVSRSILMASISWELSHSMARARFGYQITLAYSRQWEYSKDQQLSRTLYVVTKVSRQQRSILMTDTRRREKENLPV